MSELQSENGLQEVVLSADESTVSSEDREEILKQIDTVVEENKIPISKELFVLEPAKKGVFLPVIINLLAAAVIVGGFFFASWYFEQQKESLSVEMEDFLSAEGRLIAELKKETESQLAEKDSEIGQIQTQLAEIEQERTELMRTMDDQIREREEALRQDLERQLSLEKSRLEALGRSDEDIDQMLADYETQIAAEQQAELDAFKSQAEEALKQKEAELERNRAITEQILEEARVERQQLEQESQAREDELVAQYEEEKAALSEQATEAETRLEQITASQTREKLVLDQIAGTYALIETKIEAGEFSNAAADLDQLKTLLYQPAMESLPAVAARREADLFIIDSLEELVETRAAVEETKTTDSILQTANLLENARAAVLRADNAYAAGSRGEAKRLYLDAFKLVPSMSGAYTNLTNILAEENGERLAAGIAEGAAALENGDIDAAVAAYGNAVVSAAPYNEALFGKTVTGISDALTSKMNRQAAAGNEIVSGLNRSLSRESRRADDLDTSISRANTQISTLNGEIDRLSRENLRLESELKTAQTAAAELESRLNTQSAEIAALEAQLQTQTGAVTDLENSLAEESAEAARLKSQLESQTDAVADLESRLAEETAGSAAQTARAAELESQLAEKTTESAGLADALFVQTAKVRDLEVRLAEADTEYGRLETQLAAERAGAADLQTQLAAEQANAADLQTQLAAERAGAADLQTQLAAARANAADLQTQVAAEQANAADLQTQLAASRSRVETLTAENLGLQDLLTDAGSDVAALEGDLREAEERITALNDALEDAAAGETPAGAVNEDLAALRVAYDRYAASLEPLTDSDAEEDIRNAKEILSVFFERVNDRVFPGVYETWNVVDSAFVDLETSLAEEYGRKNALNEVIRYAEYVQAGSAADGASRLAFNALAQRDLLYKRAFDEITGIAEQNIGTPKLASWVLAGTVGSFSGGRITVNVDPGFTAEEGSPVIVKRLSENGEEITIARGVLTDISSGVAEADLREYLEPTAPTIRDLVFLQGGE